ncbi:MAG: S46 family peptidase, partial [Acidobacteriota bacterium]
MDNFEWPRHTGDFSFLRAYKDGKPYKPAHWLKISTDGVSEGDLVIVAGYPGRTFRYKTADEVRNYKEFVYPTSIHYYSELIRILEAQGKGKRDVQILNASRVKSLNNSLKNYQSVNEGFSKDRILEARLERETKLRATIAGDPSLVSSKSVLDDIAKVNEPGRQTRERDALLTWLLGTGTAYRGSPMLTQAMEIARLAQERPKKNVDRASGFQDRDLSRIRDASERVQRVIDPGSDRAGLRYFLEETQKLSSAQRIKPIDDAAAAAGGVE